MTKEQLQIFWLGFIIGALVMLIVGAGIVN